MKTKGKELRTAAKMTQQQLTDLVRVSSRTIISIEKSNTALLSCWPTGLHRFSV